MSTPTLVAGTGRWRRTASRRWAATDGGTTGYRVLEAIGYTIGQEITHIPHKDGGQSIQNGLGGQFEVMSTYVARAAAVRGAAPADPLVVGAPRRLPALPDTPTLAELGVPQANLASRFGLLTPGGSVGAARGANAPINRALKSAEIQARATRRPQHAGRWQGGGF